MEFPMRPDSGNPSHQIISLAAGEAHTVALAGDGSVYSWGRGMFGRLGNGSESDESSPVQLLFDSRAESLEFVGVAAGAYHSLALGDNGSVWCWGYNLYGQLGFSNENSSVPHLLELGSHCTSTDELERKSKTPLKIRAISAGGMMSLAMDDHGALWMWGNCPQQTGSGDGEFSLVSCSIPIPVSKFHGQMVAKVGCGNEHIVALVSDGGDLSCYSWGGNLYGQLGLGDTESRSTPELIKTFESKSPWAVACGAFHTAVVTNRMNLSPAPGDVCWTFGHGSHGQLGHGTTVSALLPLPVKGLPDEPKPPLVSVDCGLFHTTVVTSAGEVWSWGMEKGLGLCPDASFSGNDAGDAILPRRYGPRFPEPVQVACGAAHTVLAASGGHTLWSWGRGRGGVLGNGGTVDCYVPVVVSWPLPRDEEESVAGNGEVEKRLSLAMDELKVLHTRFSAMERYASVLHGSIFGKPFEEGDVRALLQRSGAFDVAREWENMLESADRGRLLRLEAFYRSVLAGVKDKLMKRRIQEIVKECLPSSTSGD